MAKAINWPLEFYEEVINEDSESKRIALRVGSLYFDNGYYVNGEKVDIRVNHKITRKAVIADDLQLYKIKDLSEDFLLMNKSSLRSKPRIISFLSNNYNQQIDEETVVTVVQYRNLPMENSEIMDDPHVN